MVEVTQEKLLAGARNLKAKGYTPQQVDSWLQTHGSNLADMKKYASRQKFVEKMKLTPEQKAQNAEKAKKWREQVAPTTAGDKVAEFMVTNPYARQAGFVLQGISNAGLNPAGYVARAAGMDTRPLEAQNAAERITELAGQYGYDAAAMATGLSGLAEAGVGGTGLTGNVIKALAEGGMPLAETSALGSAVLTGGVNPQSTFGRFLTDTAGGVLAPVTAAKMTQLPRSLSAAGKAVKDAFTFTPESDAVKNLREIKKLQRNINTGSLDEAMAEAERTGRSVLEVGDDAVLQAAQMARQQTPEARQIITKNLQDILEAQKARTRGVIDENLGTQGKAETLADVMVEAKRKAEPLYTDLLGKDMAQNGSDIQSFVESPYIQSEISNVRKDLTLPKNVREASDTSFDILNAVKKNIDDKIGVAKRVGENELAGRLTGIKDDLLERMDKIAPTYKEARAIYEDAFKFRDAADMGRDVFNNRQSIDEFKQTVGKMSAGEKDAVKIGVRDEMVNKLGAAYNENITNKKFLVDNTRQKLKAILGKKEGDAVIDEAEQAYKLTQNANRVLSGSQTAEKSGLRDRLQGIRRFVRNPIDTTVDYALSPFDNYNNVRLANALTNPDLAKVYNQMRLQEIIAKAIQPQKINWMPYLLAAEDYANQ